MRALYLRYLDGVYEFTEQKKVDDSFVCLDWASQERKTLRQDYGKILVRLLVVGHGIDTCVSGWWLWKDCGGIILR